MDERQYRRFHLGLQALFLHWLQTTFGRKCDIMAIILGELAGAG